MQQLVTLVGTHREMAHVVQAFTSAVRQSPGSAFRGFDNLKRSHAKQAGKIWTRVKARLVDAGSVVFKDDPILDSIQNMLMAETAAQTVEDGMVTLLNAQIQTEKSRALAAARERYSSGNFHSVSRSECRSR